MSKGWESKSVEEQQAERENSMPAQKPADTSATRGRAEKLRLQQSLELQREQILNQRTSNAHRRAALGAALEHVEQQLAALADAQ